MSTVDPAQERAERRRRWRESPRSRALLAGLAVLLLLAAVALGVGIMAIADLSRITTLNSVFADWTSDLEPLVWTFPVGLTGTILGSMAMTFAATAATGRLSFPFVGPLTIVLVGAAVGVSIAAPMLTEPLTVGVRTDPVFFEDEPWDGWAWFEYAATWWGPLLAWTLALGAVIVAIVTRRRRARNRGVLAELLATGRIVAAVVTEAPLPSPESANILGSVTVRFRDDAGVDRWASTTGAFPVSALPRAGDPAAVLFDPLAPGDTARIWIGPAGSRTVEDFTRWRIGA